MLRAQLGVLGLSVCLQSVDAHADNPIVQHIYTADPAPMVHDDTMYLCTSHDEDVTVDNFFTMNDWRVFSSKDMVNWTDHGSPISYRTFSWATGKAWAPQCVERNGKFYFYVPVSNSIGVAVADSPIGPFSDPLDRPLVGNNYQYIDPTVYIDDDGQAYLYFGNPRLWYVKLNEDMISYSGQIQQIPNTVASFGQRNGDAERPTLYEEGPWFYKRNDLYYMVFAAGPLPEPIGYSTSPDPTGPWTFKSIIMDNVSGHAFTNHAGTVDFRGHSYMFYHTQELPGGGGYKRSVAVEEFTYGQDGSIPKIAKTKNGPAAIADLNPYQRTEGETIAWTGGVEVEDCTAGGRNVSNIDNNDHIKVKSVDFGTGALSFEASVASAGPGGTIELRLDAVEGTLLGTCTVEPTGGWQSWTSVECDVDEVTDVHDLFLVFKGQNGPLFNLDYWQFTPKDPQNNGSGGAPGSGGADAGGGAGGGDAMTSGGTNAASGGTSSAVGGAPGSGGSASSTGGAVASGGRTGAGGGFASGGLIGSGGSVPAAGGAAGPDGGGDPSGAGCSCRTGKEPTPGGPWLSASALAALLLLRRSRRQGLLSN
jgi:arabinoxylan arabinofuranohydrolase